MVAVRVPASPLAAASWPSENEVVCTLQQTVALLHGVPRGTPRFLTAVSTDAAWDRHPQTRIPLSVGVRRARSIHLWVGRLTKGLQGTSVIAACFELPRLRQCRRDKVIALLCRASSALSGVTHGVQVTLTRQLRPDIETPTRVLDRCNVLSACNPTQGVQNENVVSLRRPQSERIGIG